MPCISNTWNSKEKKAHRKPTKKDVFVEGQAVRPIAILGAGSWGTALALYLARRGQAVQIWSIETAEINAMRADKENRRYMPGFSLPALIQPMATLEEVVQGVQDILIVVPSAGFKQTLKQVKPLLPTGARITCASKGLDTETGQLLSEIAEEIMGKDFPFAVLSGPSFAREVAASVPTAVVIASKHKAFLAEISERFQSEIFCIHQSHDVIGVETGGVVKNVIAIATGISDGMGFGTNTRSALITLGLAEMIRLGTALQGKLDTFIGLSGMGDLILTCSDDLSRNRRLGLSLGKGRNIEEAEREIGQVIEGKRNAELVAMLAKRHAVKMPICEAVWEILQGKVDAKETIVKLLKASSAS
jgi:glycerol-3-phosphate dehydrogenase (NAD(P)+)